MKYAITESIEDISELRGYSKATRNPTVKYVAKNHERYQSCRDGGSSRIIGAINYQEQQRAERSA
jgi:hypothetical protein